MMYFPKIFHFITLHLLVVSLASQEEQHTRRSYTVNPGKVNSYGSFPPFPCFSGIRLNFQIRVLNISKTGLFSFVCLVKSLLKKIYYNTIRLIFLSNRFNPVNKYKLIGYVM